MNEKSNMNTRIQELLKMLDSVDDLNREIIEKGSVKVEILTRNEWKKLIGDTGAAVKINVLVCLMSEDEDYTPTISEIRFKVIK